MAQAKKNKSKATAKSKQKTQSKASKKAKGAKPKTKKKTTPNKKTTTRTAKKNSNRSTKIAKTNSSDVNQPAAASNIIWKGIGWAVLGGIFLLIVVSLLGFDPADAPSSSVSVVNEDAANWCGSVGAYVAHHTYRISGVGIWVGLAAIALYLLATAFGQKVSHPPIRAFGAGTLVLASSALMVLWFPTFGSAPEGCGGLLATAGEKALIQRFNEIGTTIIIIITLAVGAIMTAEQVVLALPKLMIKSAMMLRKLPVRNAAEGLVKVGAAVAPGNTANAMNEDGSAKRSSVLGLITRRAESRTADEVETIDPDAGGFGGSESFDPVTGEPIATTPAIKASAKDNKSKRKKARDNILIEESDQSNIRSQPIPDATEIDDSKDTPTAISGKPEAVDMNALRDKISKLPVNMASKRRKVEAAKIADAEVDLPRTVDYSGYKFPSLDLLKDPEDTYSEKMEIYVRQQAEALEHALQVYGIAGEVVGIDSGPVITLYEVQLAPGTKVSTINSISSDIARALRAQNIRIVPNMAGKTTVGIEVPNTHKERVRIKELMTYSRDAMKMRLPMFLGKDASGSPLIADMNTMPHMLIAGTTGSGKSVCINTIIMSFLYTKRPDELKLILVDPKMVEMSQFRDIPHLMCPVVTEMTKAAAILEWAVTKMSERYELFAEVRVRDIASYNNLEWDEIKESLGPMNEAEEAKVPKKLPYIVFIIDELADLMMTNKEVETSIVRIAQKARAVGIHLILATQRPQANVVTGLIKSNMPCRVSFKVASGMDSRIVLDQKGAELLLGQGDMMFLGPRSSEIIRAQGTLVGDQEIRKAVRFLKDVAEPSFERQLIQLGSQVDANAENILDGDDDNKDRDPIFFDAVDIVVESGRGSVSLLQRRLAIGYTRASRLIDQMGLAGIIGAHKGSVAREVLTTPEEWATMRAIMEDEESEGTLFAPPDKPSEHSGTNKTQDKVTHNDNKDDVFGTGQDIPNIMNDKNDPISKVASISPDDSKIADSKWGGGEEESEDGLVYVQRTDGTKESFPDHPFVDDEETSATNNTDDTVSFADLDETDEGWGDEEEKWKQ